MKRHPDLSELERFFRTTYQSTYGNDVSYEYDDLKFVTTLGRDRVVCHIELAEDCFTIAWSQDSVVRLSLAFRNVQSLEISSSAGVDRLIGHIENRETDQLFKLTISPEMSFELATALPKL